MILKIVKNNFIKDLGRLKKYMIKRYHFINLGYGSQSKLIKTGEFHKKIQKKLEV